MNRLTLLACVAVWAAPAVVGAKKQAPGKLAGQWEIQSLGADRSVEIQHWGRGFTAIRIIQADAGDGTTYRLEHRFKGRISGTSVTGHLKVKEDNGPLETLRPFAANIVSDDEIRLDGMILKRVPPPEPELPPATAGDDPRPKMAASVAALVGQGDDLAARKKYTDALGRYDQGIRKGGPKAFLLMKIGVTFEAMGRKDRAERALKNAQKADPKNAAVEVALARVQGRPAKLAAPPAGAAAPPPPPPPPGAEVATGPATATAAANTDTPAAPETTTGAVAAPEMSAEVQALVERGDALGADKDYIRALAAYDKGLSKGGPRGFLLHRIGTTFIAMGRTDRAKRALNNALKAEPDNAAIRATLDGL